MSRRDEPRTLAHAPLLGGGERPAKGAGDCQEARGLLQASARPLPVLLRARIVQRRLHRLLPGALRGVLLGLAGSQVPGAQLPVLQHQTEEPPTTVPHGPLPLALVRVLHRGHHFTRGVGHPGLERVAGARDLVTVRIPRVLLPRERPARLGRPGTGQRAHPAQRRAHRRAVHSHLPAHGHVGAALAPGGTRDRVPGDLTHAGSGRYDERIRGWVRGTHHPRRHGVRGVVGSSRSLARVAREMARALQPVEVQPRYRFSHDDALHPAARAVDRVRQR